MLHIYDHQNIPINCGGVTAKKLIAKELQSSVCGENCVDSDKVVLNEILNTLGQNSALLETVQPWTINLLDLIPNTNEFCDGMKSESTANKSVK